MPDSMKNYVPPTPIRWLYDRMFNAIDIDPRWASIVSEASEKGTVVYVQRTLSDLDFVALDYLIKRHGLPQAVFANDLGLWFANAFGKGAQRLFQRQSRESEIKDLHTAIDSDASAILFLKKPPTRPFGPRFLGRGLLAGDEFLRELFVIQRERTAAGKKPIVLVPQVIVWAREPDTRGENWVDTIFGTREMPTFFRALGQFILHPGEVHLRACEPIDLSEFMQKEKSGDDSLLVRRVIYTALRRMVRERRLIVGPTQKSTDRMIDDLVRLPRIQKVIHEVATESKSAPEVIDQKARAITKQLAAEVDPEAVRLFARIVTETITRIFDGIEVDFAGLQRVREFARNGNVVLVPSHKSTIDNFIVSYMLQQSGMPVPLIAAGDNLNFFPVGGFLRRSGAFFIRRKIGADRLYTTLLTSYVHKMLRDGYSIEFFIEGRRSRTGKVLQPQMGLLSMIAEYAYAHPERQIFFAPISIGYERLVESSGHVSELLGGAKQAESFMGLVRSLRMFREKYGHLTLQVGTIMTLDDLKRDLGTERFFSRRAIVSRLAHRITYELSQNTLVTPGAVTALCLLTHLRGELPESVLRDRIATMLRVLEPMGARVQEGLRGEGGTMSEHAFDEAIQLFVRAGWLQKKSISAHRSSYIIPDDTRIALNLTKNSGVHFFVPIAFFAHAFLVSRAAFVDRKSMIERCKDLSRLFREEFTFRVGTQFESLFDDTAQIVERLGWISRATGPDGEPLFCLPNEPARASLQLLATILDPFFEGYLVAIRAFQKLQKLPLAETDLIWKAFAVGRTMLSEVQIRHREAIQRPLIENAINVFLEDGILARDGGRIVLSAKYADLEALKSVEHRVSVYLDRAEASP
jgi:glycerol-3-phosphate O-acyltransferase